MEFKRQSSPFISVNSNPASGNSANGFLGQERAFWNDLFRTQPPAEQQFLETQGRELALAIQSHAVQQVRFQLPARVLVHQPNVSTPQACFLTLAKSQREQWACETNGQPPRSSLVQTLRQRLDRLEANGSGSALQAYPEIALGAGLVRFCTAHSLVHDLLPAGQDLRYASEPDEDVPSIPLERQTAAWPVQAFNSHLIDKEDQAAFTLAAELFYLPEWVVFDELGQLLVDTFNEAKARIVSTQAYLSLLHAAAALAPYMVTDPAYQRRRNGILGQLINQGRALARHEIGETLVEIQKQAAAMESRPTLQIRLPYFDDQALELRSREIKITPIEPGNLTPAWLACQHEASQVTQDTRMSRSTRKHLLGQLSALQQAIAADRRA